LLIAYIRTLFVMANRAVILEESNASLTGKVLVSDASKPVTTNEGVTS